MVITTVFRIKYTIYGMLIRNNNNNNDYCIYQRFHDKYLAYDTACLAYLHRHPNMAAFSVIVTLFHLTLLTSSSHFRCCNKFSQRLKLVFNTPTLLVSISSFKFSYLTLSNRGDPTPYSRTVADPDSLVFIEVVTICSSQGGQNTLSGIIYP